MKVALAILLNAALLAVLLPWLWRQWQQVRGWTRAVLVLSLSARLAVGIAGGLHLTNDAEYMSVPSRALTAELWAAPGAALDILRVNKLHFAGYDMVFHSTSNTLLFIKVLVLLNLGSLGNDWLNALYLSIFSFVGCWQLARALGRAFPQTPAGAGALAFGLWPSVIYWASGVTKESVVLGSSTWLLAVFVELFYARQKPTKARQLMQVVTLVVLAVLHFNMRYFFAAPLIGVLTGLALLRLLQQAGLARGRWAQVVVMTIVLGGGAWLASEVSPVFRLNKFTNQVMIIYTHDLRLSLGRPHFEYPDLRPTPESTFRHMPLAVVNALTRPWLGESKELRYVVVGLENALLLVLLVVAVLAAWRGKSGKLPFGLVLALIIYCLVVAILIGLSTPNLGTMHRYRSGMLPYLVLLLLQNDYATAALRRLGLRNEEGVPE